MDKYTLARTLAMIIVGVLDILKAFCGIDFGIASDQVENIILAIISIAITLRVWWKDNNVTKKRKLKEFAFQEMERVLEADKEVDNE